MVFWPHGQQSHPHTIKEPFPPMCSREEHVIQSERALTWRLKILRLRRLTLKSLNKRSSISVIIVELLVILDQIAISG